MSRVVWTPGRLAAAKKVLRRHERLDQACVDVSQALSASVSPNALEKAFARAGEASPHSFLKQAPPTPVEELKRRIEAKDAARRRHGQGLTGLLLEKVQAALAGIQPDTITVRAQQGPAHAPKGRPEILWVEVSDVQLGTKVDRAKMGGLNGHDWRTFLGKLARWEERVGAIVAERRALAPLERVVVSFGGDIVEGHGIFRSQAYSLDQDVFGQVIYGARDFAQAVARLAASHPEVPFLVCGVGGNHGRIGSFGEAPYRANFDLILYEVIRLRLEALELPNVVVDFPEAWFQLIDTWGWTHLLVHGDDVKGWGGLPFYGLARALAKHQQQFQRVIHYMHIGHFHTESAISTSLGHLLVNGNWIGTNEYSKQLMETNVPMQMVHAFTEEDGLVWSERVYLTSRKDARPRLKVRRADAGKSPR